MSWKENEGMHQRHEGDPEACKPGRIDLWDFHIPGDKRELPSLDSLRYYALSPSTDRVECINYTSDSNPEMRVYGPSDKMAWYELPLFVPTAEYILGLRKLCWQLTQRDKLRSG
jgi:hypothetical protein